MFNFCFRYKMLLQLNSYLIVLLICFCEGQPAESNLNTTSLIPAGPPSIRSCCEPNEYFDGVSCKSLKNNHIYTEIYFPSNSTHINTDSIYFNLTLKVKPLICKTESLYSFGDSEILGFIYNGSAIIKPVTGIVNILNENEYCVSTDEDSNITIIFSCEEIPISISEGKIYFPCLIISTICYVITTIIYIFILGIKKIEKKCFVGFCISMAVTFLFLILLQQNQINDYCKVLGSIFFLSILSAFIWLLCLCIEMMYLCRTIVELNNQENHRFYLYLASSLLIPSFILLLSVTTSPKNFPDVPNSFMKEKDNICNDFSDSRIIVLFIPIGIFLIGAIATLSYTFYIIKENNKKYSTEILWLGEKNYLKYKTRSCLMIWIPSFIWVVDAAVENLVKGTPQVYVIIEGLQGVFVIAVFVLNRYTRKELKSILCKKKNLNYGDTERRWHKLLERFRSESTMEEVERCETDNVNSSPGL